MNTNETINACECAGEKKRCATVVNQFFCSCCDGNEGDPGADGASIIQEEVLNGIEIKTNTYWRGKPVYKREVIVESLPNSAIKKYNLGNYDIHAYKSIAGIVESYANSWAPLPFVDPTQASYMIGVWVENWFLHIQAGINRSNQKAYITLEYIKTTDATDPNKINDVVLTSI